MNITTSLKLPFQFDVEKLTTELNFILESDWEPHFNKNGYDGDWNSIALYAVGGDQRNIFAHNTEDAKITETPILEHCNYLKNVIAHFKCPLLSVRLLKLSVGSFIKPHRDFELGYEDGCFRLHIPIVTNPKVSFILDEQKLEMEAGDCWYTNVNYIHSVSNEGTSDRVHLVIDGQRTAWSDELFFSLVPKESLLKRETQSYDAETIEKIISELEQQQGVGAKQLVEELRIELEKHRAK